LSFTGETAIEKQLSVDDSVAVIGTSNLDIRSFAVTPQPQALTI
jgi:hypothetical protein